MATGAVNVPSSEKSAESRRRIMAAAREEVEAKGILGLRVQDVARNAGVSVPLIYKYFGDRDGLLADVLSGMFVDCSKRRLAAASGVIGDGSRSVTPVQLVQALMLPPDEQVRKDRALTLQMLAAAAEIPALATRLAATQREVHSQLNAFIADTFNKLGLDDSVPVAALSMLIQASALGFVFNDMLGTEGVSHNEFARLLRVLVGAVVEKHTA